MEYIRQYIPGLTKILVLVLIFGIFPAGITVVANSYGDKAAMVLEAKNPVNKTEFATPTSGEARVLTLDQSKTLQRVKGLIVGKWMSLQDKKYTVDILPNYTFTDKDGDNVVAYGTWGNFVSATSSSNIQLDQSNEIGGVNNLNTSYYLTKLHSEDKYKNERFVYEIMQLDEDRAILYYTGNDKILYFVRVTNAATTSPEII